VIPTVAGADIRGIPIAGRLVGGDVESGLESLLSTDGDEDRVDLDAWNYINTPTEVIQPSFSPAFQPEVFLLHLIMRMRRSYYYSVVVRPIRRSGRLVLVPTVMNDHLINLTCQLEGMDVMDLRPIQNVYQLVQVVVDGLRRQCLW
jgi:hypothetical protein